MLQSDREEVSKIPKSVPMDELEKDKQLRSLIRKDIEEEEEDDEKKKKEEATNAAKKEEDMKDDTSIQNRKNGIKEEALTTRDKHAAQKLPPSGRTASMKQSFSPLQHQSGIKNGGGFENRPMTTPSPTQSSPSPNPSLSIAYSSSPSRPKSSSPSGSNSYRKTTPQMLDVSHLLPAPGQLCTSDIVRAVLTELLNRRTEMPFRDFVRYFERKTEAQKKALVDSLKEVAQFKKGTPCMMISWKKKKPK